MNKKEPRHGTMSPQERDEVRVRTMRALEFIADSLGVLALPTRRQLAAERASSGSEEE